jgi:hypothetical protein
MLCKYLLSIGVAAAMIVPLQAQTAAQTSQTPNQQSSQTTQQQSTTNQRRSMQNTQNNGWNSQNSTTQGYNSGQEMQNPKAKGSDEVFRMLRDTERARAAIRTGDIQQAKQDVNDADHLVTQIGSMSQTKNGMVPLYQELGEYVNIQPPSQNQQQNGSRWNNSQSNDRSDRSSQSNNSGNQWNNTTNQNRQSYNQNGNSNANQAAGDVDVQSVVGQYTSVALDTNMAKNHLEAAQQALNNNNPQAADQALRAVQDSLVESSVATDMPLMRARQNLMLARSAANQGDYAEAQAALKGASQALQNYEQNGGRHANDARQLRSQIDSFDQSIQQNHTNASAKIESWWNQITDWNTPATTAHNSGH